MLSIKKLQKFLNLNFYGGVKLDNEPIKYLISDSYIGILI